MSDILHASDLHIDVNESILDEYLLDDVVDVLKKKDFDMMVISGDITNDMEKSLQIVEELEYRIGKKVWFIPGNHDVWTLEEEGSKKAYEKYLNHNSCLVGNPCLIGEDKAIVGSMGWYDYSFRLDGVKDEKVEMMKRVLWNDSRFVRWGKMKDKDIMEEVLSQLEKDLEKVKDRKVWVATHFVPYKEFLTYKNEYNWDFCNAYIGSKRMGELLDQYENVDVVTFGHTHRRFGCVEFRNKLVICNPLGYVSEWDTLDFKQELEKAINLIQF